MPPEAETTVILVERLIRQAIERQASDVHFEPDEQHLRVRYRIDGLLHDVERLPAAIAPNIAARLKVLGGLLTYRTDVPQEGAISRERSEFGCEIRVSSFPTIAGERVVLRLLGSALERLKLDQLGFTPELTARLCTHLTASQGLLLVCGPAGSGKTTTLHAMLTHLTEERPDQSIITVEDPVEVRLAGITQVEIHPQRGLTYPVVLRSLLRQDPQVLMVGEIRDAETAHIACEAALTGHLLLSTMHSGTPAEAIVRLREMGVPPYQITSALRGILAQRLLRTLAKGEQIEPPTYAGRTACGWLVELTGPLRAAILDEADSDRLSDPALSPGSLRVDAERLVKAGKTTPDEVRRVLGAGAAG